MICPSDKGSNSNRVNKSSSTQNKQKSSKVGGPSLKSFKYTGKDENKTKTKPSNVKSTPNLGDHSSASVKKEVRFADDNSQTLIPAPSLTL